MHGPFLHSPREVNGASFAFLLILMMFRGAPDGYDMMLYVWVGCSPLAGQRSENVLVPFVRGLEMLYARMINMSEYID